MSKDSNYFDMIGFTSVDICPWFNRSTEKGTCGTHNTQLKHTNIQYKLVQIGM